MTFMTELGILVGSARFSCAVNASLPSQSRIPHLQGEDAPGEEHINILLQTFHPAGMGSKKDAHGHFRAMIKTKL